jgi:hypothetical protein
MFSKYVRAATVNVLLYVCLIAVEHGFVSSYSCLDLSCLVF